MNISPSRVQPIPASPLSSLTELQLAKQQEISHWRCGYHKRGAQTMNLRTSAGLGWGWWTKLDIVGCENELRHVCMVSMKAWLYLLFELRINETKIFRCFKTSMSNKKAFTVKIDIYILSFFQVPWRWSHERVNGHLLIHNGHSMVIMYKIC